MIMVLPEKNGLKPFHAKIQVYALKIVSVWYINQIFSVVKLHQIINVKNL